MPTWFVKNPDKQLWFRWASYLTVPIGEYSKKRQQSV
jgi:hypothetical protein